VSFILHLLLLLAMGVVGGLTLMALNITIRRWLARRRYARRLLDAFPVFPDAYVYVHDGRVVMYGDGKTTVRDGPGTVAWRIEYVRDEQNPFYDPSLTLNWGKGETNEEATNG
jgi:hypothetical protein